MGGAAVSSFRSQVENFIGFALRYAGFWMVYFLLCRIAFVCYHGAKLSGFSASTVAGIFGFGAYIDLSTACYLIIIPYFIWFAASLFPMRPARALVAGYSYLCIVIVAVISVADLQVYQEWGTKLNAQAISYLRYPQEAYASMASSPLLLLIGLALLLAVLGLLLYGKICQGLPFNNGRERFALSRIPLFLFFAALIFLGIRGSVGVAPMNPSFAFFSQEQFANHAALNASWNLVYDFKYMLRHKGNSFAYMDESQMRSRVEKLLGKGTPNDTEYILTSKRPNIVVFILESWTADVIEPLGAEPGITPFFSELSREGILCTDFYANGYRSSFGIPAVLAGYPSTPEGSILNHPLKVDRIPTLAGSLRQGGYHTSFYYGGDDRFDDMHSFLIHSKFERVVDRDAFQKKDMNSKWGAQDHVLFNRVLDDLSHQQAPFFTAMFTLSSHEPFEVPMEPVYKGKDGPSLFKNAIHYSDRSLKGFFERARKEPWYKNTLFVLVADHGHPLPLNRPNNFMPERYRIPLLLVGDVLKKEYRGVRKGTTASQSDIAATILAQVGLPTDGFEWSNNLFNRNRNNYAFYNFNTGFALRTAEQTTAFDNVAKTVVLRTHKERSVEQDAESLKDTEAYMQYLFKRYKAL